MRKTKLLPLILALTLVLCSCGNDGTGDNSSGIGSENQTGDSSNGAPVDTDFSKTDEDMFSSRDKDSSYKDSNFITIQLNGSSATASSDKVQINGSTITITDEGTYVISGTLNDGMIIVNAEETDKPQLVLDNANITSASSAAIYVLEADKVFITLKEGSSNSLSNGGSFVSIDDNNIDGVIYSKQDLTLNGNGSLTISAPADHGIVCKDDLVFTGGTYSITSAGHGLDVNDSVRVSDGTFTIDAGKDGIHIENTEDATKGFVYISNGNFNIEAEGDGIDAGYYVQIENGSFTLLCGGGYENGAQHSSNNWGNMGGMSGGGGRPGGRSSDGSTSGTGMSDFGATDTTDDGSTSMKGIKGNSSILINGGSFNIDSADDSIHSNLSVYINNGSFEIASGDDGIHGEEELTITGGSINITQSYEGLEALDIAISGGSIQLKSTDDGINAAGGTDSSGTGGRDQMFGGGGMGGMHGGMGGMSAGNGSIVISGGSIFMYAQGDGIDANGTLEISGGTTIVTGPTQGDTAILDYDSSATITGGTFIGVGAINMAQSFSSNTQGVLALQASGSAGSEIKLLDASGKEIITYTPEQNFSCIILSSPQMVTGESYTIHVGTANGTFDAQ